MGLNMSNEGVNLDVNVDVSGAEKVPGIYANKFTIQVGEVVSRINFAESIADDIPAVYRSSIIIQTKDLFEIGRVIDGIDRPGNKNAK